MVSVSKSGPRLVWHRNELQLFRDYVRQVIEIDRIIVKIRANSPLFKTNEWRRCICVTSLAEACIENWQVHLPTVISSTLCPKTWDENIIHFLCTYMHICIYSLIDASLYLWIPHSITMCVFVQPTIYPTIHQSSAHQSLSICRTATASLSDPCVALKL